MQSSGAVNVKVPDEEAPPEGRELSPSQLNLPQEEVEAGGAMSSQGLGEVPGEGRLLFVRLAEMSENMKTMAILMKNIQNQQSKNKIVRGDTGCSIANTRQYEQSCG